MANTLFNQKSSSIKVNIGSSGGVVGSTLSANAVTLTNTAAGKKKIAQMEDVNDTTLVDGGTLVYDADNDQYNLQALDVDGGTF
jgi:predicted MarR family transcription regulator